MDKTKVYSKTGRILLSVWVITWAILICKFSIPYKGFNNFMASTFVATVLNLALNPCAFVGALLLDLIVLKKHPERRRGWVHLVILYLVLWIGLGILVFWGSSLGKPTVTILGAIPDSMGR